MATTVYQYRHHCTTCADYVLTWAPTDPEVCPNNNTHVLTNIVGVIVDKVTEENLIDAQNRLVVAQRSGSLDYTTQWVTRGDDVGAVSGPIRNAGNSTFLCTKSTSPGLVIPSLGLTNSAVDGGLGSYQLNALQHHIFENQIPLTLYEGIYGKTEGVDWKRKRVRVHFMDNLQCKSMWVHWAGGKLGKIFGHAFVFMCNKYVANVGLSAGNAFRPDGTVGLAYNPDLPHNVTTNPVGWVASTYAEEVPLIGSCEKGIDFIAEDSSAELNTGSGMDHLIELWSELTYDPSSFTDTEAGTCGTFIRLMAYSAQNIDNTWS